ncbi:AI-2E family transporter [Fusibacter bizertensis]|uniref:AI-2E family transporter n=1 Tax=Fusibacter bizertensis TaxID=1488331 RepID=A0ABT6NFF4_9FIRM|nr:AI-2E family transporter [Fusibacter bizertensis]MDH8679162.1 AI-2E family transporter [Fusibacter bizertensis]
MAEFRKYFPIITFAVLLYLGASNLNIVLSFISKIISVLMPLIMGIGIAFILNLLLNKFEKNLFMKRKMFKNNKWLQNHLRFVSMVSTYLITILIFAVIIIFVFPQVAESSKTLIDKLPEYSDKIAKYATELYEELGLTDDIMNQVFSSSKDLLIGLSSFTAETLLKAVGVTISITTGALTTLMGIIFSIYILASKEKFINIISKMNRAFIPKKPANYLANLMENVNLIFSKFVGGQITEAFILGTLCFIGLLVFKIPYAPLVSVLIAVTSLIPFVGAFIGTVPSILIIAMESPSKALFFLIFIVILQQLEGNIIYPKVVGDAIGIGGFWVFLAITVGGGLFGVLGMLLGVPLMAVLYTVVRTEVNNRLAVSKDH